MRSVVATVFAVMNNRSSAQKKRKPIPTWLCAASPLFLFLAFTSFGLHLRLACGEWPGADWKSLHFHEPGYLLLRIHEIILGIVGLFTIFAAGPRWIVFLCSRPLRLSVREHCFQVVANVLGWGAVVAAVMIAPAKFLAWFLA